MKTLENAPDYSNLHLTPLQVDVYFASAPVFYDPPTLDATLAYAVVREATQGQGLPETATPYYIPLPLEKLWTCPKTGAPLWNATQFFPLLPNTEEAVFWHKRGYRPEVTQRTRGKPHNARFGQGRHKEYRMPLPRQSCLQWRAFCVGDRTEIQRLVSSVASLGKKRTQGHGRVLRYEFTAIAAVSYFQGRQAIKAFPIAYPQRPDVPGDVIFSIYEVGWTPPYWLETLFQTCIV